LEEEELVANIAVQHSPRLPTAEQASRIQRTLFGNPQGCAKVAGGRSAAETSGTR